VKIGDFGISKMLDTVDYTQTGVGTPLYFSPEICKGEKYSYKTDMWMLGCLLYELCTLRRPFISESINALIDKIINSEPEEIVSSLYSDDLKLIIKSLLSKNPEERWGIKEIYKNGKFIKYMAKYSNETSFTKKIDFNKLKINIEEDNTTPIRFNKDKDMNYKKLTLNTATCQQPSSDRSKIFKNFKMSPRLSPNNRQLVITESNLSYLDMKVREEKVLEPTRNKSTNSLSTTSTSELRSMINIPRPMNNLMKQQRKGHLKHISINISSCQSPDNMTSTYKVENIEKIEEIEFPKSQYKLPTPTNSTNTSLFHKLNPNEIRELPKSTKHNERYDNNFIKQLFIERYGKEKFEKIYKIIINRVVSDEAVKEIVGEDNDALNYVKYLIEYYDNI
jgi:serine/threonine protein kinase